MVESLAIGELQYVIGQGATTICDLPFPQNVEPNDHLSFLTIWDVLWICYSNLQVLRWADAAAEKVVHVLPISVRAWWKDQPCPHWLQVGCEMQPSTPQHPMYQDRDRDVRGQRRDKLWPLLQPWQDLAVLCWQSPSAGQRAGMVWQCHSLHVFKTELCHHFCCLPCLSTEEKGFLSEISGARCSLKAAFFWSHPENT